VYRSNWGFRFSDVVLEDRPWPRGSSRTKNHVLGLGLGLESSGLGLEGRGLGLGLGLEGPGLDYKHVNFIFWDVWCKCVSPIFSKFLLSMQCTVDPFYFLTIRHLYIYGVS
jgi:hypothetical protein